MHDDWLAERFEEHRGRLTAIAQRMLGSPAEADDAVQEAWIRLSRSDAEAIDNLGAWLTTVVSRVCLNTLQSRRARPEQPLADDDEHADAGPGPEQEALLADAVGLALLVVLDALTPAERVAFVLHDMFAVPFEEIAPIVGRNAPATRQLASRARRRVQRDETAPASDRVRHAKVVDAFLAAARNGDFEALLGLLDPDVVLRADDAVMAIGAPREMRGAQEVGAFCTVARGATPALVDGEAGVVWIVRGRVRVAYAFTTAGDRITAIELIGEPEGLARVEPVIEGGR